MTSRTEADSSRADTARGRRRKRIQGRPGAEPPVERAAADVSVPRELRGGWRVVAAKEFTDQVLSLRFLILTIVLALAAATAVYATASAIRDVASQASGVVPSLFLKVFTVSNGDIPSFTSFIAFLAPLLGIAFGFDGINGERAEGTLPRLLAQPIHRDDVINGKFIAGLSAISVIFLAITAIVAAIGILVLGVLPSTEEVLRLLVWVILAVAYVGFWLALALLCSVLLRRAATSALTAMAIWLALTLFATLLVGLVAGFLSPVPANAATGSSEQLANASLQYNLARLSPSQLFQESTAAVLDPTLRTLTPGLITAQQASNAIPSILSFDQSLLVVWPQFVALIAMTGIVFGVTYVAFMRQEVRA
jgi:ABC-2 type transport system permease protein